MLAPPPPAVPLGFPRAPPPPWPTANSQRKQPSADEYMRSIKRSLNDAVDSCIEAAGHEVAPATQRSLLKVRAGRARTRHSRRGGAGTECL